MEIGVENLREGEAVGYPLVLLEGHVRCAGGALEDPSLPANCFLDATISGLSTRWRWPVARHSGAFKTFVLLPSAGEFSITLRLEAPDCERVFHVVYSPPTAPKFTVRFYYQKSSDATDSAQGFDAPHGVDTSDAAAVARIQTAALLMQTATAEMMYAAGLGRRSFALEFEDGLPAVRLLRSSFSDATARSIRDQELIQRVGQDITTQGLDTDAEHEFKHAVILGCSTYNPETRKAEGHTALGGGKVGIFGSCGLHTWPSRLEELTACCLNNAKIDTTRLLDDSCYRGTFWANFSTGIGAFLHELGHTFGLGHSESGIMARGFDDMNKLFSVYEINSRSPANGYIRNRGDAHRLGFLELNYDKITEIAHKGGAHWNLGSAALLRHCPWISGQERRSRIGPTVSWDNSVRGPVGHGTYDGDQHPLSRCSSHIGLESADIGGVLVEAGQYVDNIETRTREEMAALLATNACLSTGNKHWVVLLENEYIQQVDVRAMAWIDGLQIHTNLRSTRWFGGFGGKLHSLKVADGHAVSGFFGSRGNCHVGTLGICCLPVPGGIPPIPSRVITQGSHLQLPSQCSLPAGLALERPQTTFECNNLVPGGAVIVRCSTYVESFCVVSPQAFENSINNPVQNAELHPNEHAFQLMAGEDLLSMEVKSGHWVDAIRFWTNRRLSPWYGGVGGSQSVLVESPPGFCISGFFGSHGQRYLGCIGAIYSPKYGLLSSSLSSGQENDRYVTPIERDEAGPAAFSLLGRDCRLQSSPERAACGVLVGLISSGVAFIESFQSADECASIAQILSETSSESLSFHWIALSSGEAVVQIDASFRTVPSDSGISSTDGLLRVEIDGVCIHTTSRCSEWLGSFHDDKHLKFYVAPPGCGVLHLSGQYGPSGSSLIDITGLSGSLLLGVSESAHPSRGSDSSSLGSHVKLARWGTDVRIEASSPNFSIDSVVVSRRTPQETLDSHAWLWSAFFGSEAAIPACHRWCIPQRMLEDHLRSELQASDAKSRLEAVKKNLVLSATDTGGWN
jgi:hypothetical protein